MGQKISVNLFRAYKRLGNVSNNSGTPSELQKSVWFASAKSYSKLHHHDEEIRTFLRAELQSAGLVEAIIRRNFKKLEIVVFVTKPGIVIGRAGSTINKLKEDLITKFALPKDFKFEVQEFRDLYGSANVIANEISQALIKGMPFRRVAKGYIEKIKYSGILGAKILIKGRLNGAEIARKEVFPFGSIPRHTIDSNIDYALVHSQTKAGIIGIKVWLYRGDKLKNYTY